MAIEEATYGLFSESLTLQSLLLLVGLLGLISYVCRRPKTSIRSPPGPRGWPIFGNLLSLDFHSERVMYDWSKEYGPVCHLKMVGKNVALLGTLEAMQEAFIKKGDCFSDRMQNSIPPMFGDTGIVFLNYNEYFKEQRNFGLKALREFGMGRRSIEPKVHESIGQLCDRLEEFAVEGKALNIEKMIYEAVSAVISKLVFNRDIPAENATFKMLLHQAAEGDEYSVYNGLLVFFPFLKHFPPFSYTYQGSMRFDIALCDNIRKQIHEHVMTRCKNNPRDVIDCFLDEMDNAKDLRRPSTSDGKEYTGVKINTSFTEIQLIKLVRDLFLAGSDTTSTAFTWLLLYVSKYPKIQEKLHREIDEVLGDEIPKFTLSEKLPYIKAVIQETHRIRPVVPLGVPHVATRDSTLFGFDIPKGTLLMSNIFRIHHDESIWKDPETFDPDRHLDEQGEFVKLPHVLPFSVGARQCLGQQLANMELFLLVATLFQRFSFKLLDEDKVDMMGQNVFTLRPPRGFEVLVKKR